MEKIPENVKEAIAQAERGELVSLGSFAEYAEDSVEDVVQDLMEQIQEVANNSRRWSQANSVEIYRAIAGDCNTWANQITEEME